MPSKEIDIKSNISGVLDELFVNVGQQVHKGQVIARIRVETNPAEYRQLQKRLEIAEAQFRSNQTNYNRSWQLYEKKVIAAADLEREQISFLLAKAEYEAALAEWQIVSNDTKFDNRNPNAVIATDDGTLLELPVRTGGPVMSRGSFSEGTTVARIARLDNLVFRGYVAEADVGALKEGMLLNLIVSAIKDYKISGTLRLIAPKGVLHEGITKFEIEADVIIPQDLTVMLRAGYSASAEITVESKEKILSLEEKHLNFSGDSVYVETMNQIGKWERTTIITGTSDGIYTEIISGIDSMTVVKAYENN